MGDARWTGRALRLASDWAAHPDLSLSSIYTGPIGSGTEQGFLLHSALALTTAGVPLGLVGQIA